MNHYGLTERELKMLILLVDSYISTGEPVGSRLLSKHKDVDLSPATLRNIMTDMTEKNIIVQPHTSAGRIPTDLGYRIYVDCKLSESSGEKNVAVNERISDLSVSEGTEKIFESTAKYLSGETRLVALVTSPYLQDSILKKLDFICLDESHIVVVLVTVAGVVFHKTIMLREPVDPKLLESVQDHINRVYKFTLLSEIKSRLSDMFSADAENQDYRMSTIIRLCRKAFTIDGAEEVFVSGVENLFGMGLENNETASDLLRTVSDRGAVIELLKTDSKVNTVSVLIGTETKVSDLHAFSLIKANYALDKRPLGSIGVIGPKRMQYDKIYTIIKETADHLSHELSVNK